MRSYRYRLWPVLLLFSLFSARSQDKIYLKNDKLQGKIVKITPSEVIYNPSETPLKQMSIDLKEALLLFNERGDFILPSTLEFGKDETLSMIDRFLNKNGVKYSADRIYTSTKAKSEGTVNNIDKKYAYIVTENDTQKIELKIIAAIIYKTGDHTFYRDPVKVAEALSNFRTDITAMVAKDAEALAEKKRKDQQNSGGESAPNKTPDYSALLGSVSKEEFADKALQKTHQLSEYIKLICNRQSATEDIIKATSQALVLFASEQARVEVSSVTRRNLKVYKIKEYLAHIKLTQYDKVEIEWNKVQYVNEVKKGPDGNYYGTVTFEQVFRGYKDGRLAYHDITLKKISVMLKGYEKNVEGKVLSTWDVLLSDIGVTSTES